MIRYIFEQEREREGKHVGVKARSNFFLLLTSMIWGFAFIAQLESAGRIGTLGYNAVRYLLGSLSLLPVILLFERKKRGPGAKHDLRIGVACGVLLCLATNLQQEGITLMHSAGKAAFITGFYTVLVPLFALLFWRKKTRWNVWLGALLALLGLGLLCLPGSADMQGQNSYLGMALVIVATFFWAGHILLVSRLTGDLGSLTFSAFQFALCGLLSLLGSALLERVGPAAFWDQIVAARYPILYGGLLSVGVAYTCQVVGQRGANPTAAAILLSTEAVFGSLGEVVYHRWTAPDPAFRPMSAIGWAGCAVLFLGILCSQLTFKRHRLS